MLTKLRSVAVLLLLVPLALLAACGQTGSAGSQTSSSAPPSTSSSSAASTPASQLVGAWQMTKLEMGTDGQLQTVPYSGQIIFTAAGGVAVQAANPDTKAADGPYTVNGYEAYYGTYTVDGDNQGFTMNVTSAAVRDLVGQNLSRKFTVDDSTLVLTPADPAEGFRVTYQRT